MKNNIHKILFLGCFTLLMSCGVPLGDRVDSNNLSVYFEKGVSKEEAKGFSRFWQQQGFVGEEPQTIQLASEGKTIRVKLIEHEAYQNQPLSIKERALLSELERTIEREVFVGKSVEIVITDNTFRPIEREGN